MGDLTRGISDMNACFFYFFEEEVGGPTSFSFSVMRNSCTGFTIWEAMYLLFALFRRAGGHCYWGEFP